MICGIFHKDFETYRLVVVSLTGFITLKLLYTICKPLSTWRKILIIFCSISFLAMLIILPDLFLVGKFGIVNSILILLFAFVDVYVIEFFEKVYDRIIFRIRGWKNERNNRKNKKNNKKSKRDDKKNNKEDEKDKLS